MLGCQRRSIIYFYYYKPPKKSSQNFVKVFWTYKFSSKILVRNIFGRISFILYKVSHKSLQLALDFDYLAVHFSKACWHDLRGGTMLKDICTLLILKPPFHILPFLSPLSKKAIPLYKLVISIQTLSESDDRINVYGRVPLGDSIYTASLHYWPVSRISLWKMMSRCKVQGLLRHRVVSSSKCYLEALSWVFWHLVANMKKVYKVFKKFGRTFCRPRKYSHCHESMIMVHDHQNWVHPIPNYCFKKNLILKPFKFWFDLI